MTELSSDFPSQPQNEVAKAVPNSSRRTSGASGSLPFRLSASLILTMLVMSAQLCRSQDGSAPPRAGEGPADQKQASKRTDSSTQPSGQERVLGILPGYGMVEAGRQPPPLTSGQKFKLAAQYLNPYTFVFVAAEAGINQARNHPEDYGQGAEGYGKRYGAGLADGLTFSACPAAPFRGSL